MQHPSRLPRREALRGLALLALGGLPAAGPAWAHRAEGPSTTGVTRTTAAYTVPDLTLVDADGAPMPLRQALAPSGPPVLLNFIFTTCSAVCPVLSSVFAQVQGQLAREREPVRMVSFSIDPEQDTPLALKAYGRSFGAGPQWRMLTGRPADCIAVQRAFDAWRGDKMNHVAAAFLRAGWGGPWVRLEGFASAADLLREYRQLRRG